MRCISPRISRNAGFTLIEVMVIAPVIILVITGLVALIIVLTGDVLRVKGTNDLIFNTQNALSQIEQDVKQTIEFRQTGYIPTSPQGQADNTLTFDIVSQATTHLILRSIATDKNPINGERKLIYKQSGGTCSTVPYTFDIVYFTKVTGGVTSLWRRVVFGDTTQAGTPCTGTTPWQEPSCTPGYSSAVCKTEDSLLAENVASLSVQYHAADGTLLGSGTMPTAKSVTITLNVANTVAGRESTYTGSVEASIANNSALATAPGSISYSDDFTASGQLGNVKSGTPVLPWLFLNSTTANWSRNSTGYATSSTAAVSNPMAIADVGTADVSITEGVRSTGNAIYFRVVDGNNWLRTRVETTQIASSPSASYYYSTGCYGQDSCNQTASGTGTTAASAMSACSSQWLEYPYYGGCNSATYVPDYSYSRTLILDKAINGAVTQFASTSIGSSVPAYIKMVAKGGSIQTSYGSTSSTTSTGSSATDTTNQSATKHGIGYANSSYGSPTGVNSISIINAP